MWEKTKKKDIPNVWFSLKNSLSCKSQPSDVHDPRREREKEKQLSSILTKKTGRSGCSRSITNLKDVIHGSKRHIEKPTTCSPRSIGSSEFLNPITHEVILSNSKCELKITGFGGFHEDFSSACGSGGGTFVGNLRPGTPGPPLKNSAARKNLVNSNLSLSHKRAPCERNGNGGNATCHKCGEQFVKWEALESHHLSKHAGNF